MNLERPLWRRCYLHLRWYFFIGWRVKLFCRWCQRRTTHCVEEGRGETWKQGITLGMWWEGIWIWEIISERMRIWWDNIWERIRILCDDVRIWWKWETGHIRSQHGWVAQVERSWSVSWRLRGWLRGRLRGRLGAGLAEHTGNYSIWRRRARTGDTAAPRRLDESIARQDRPRFF